MARQQKISMFGQLRAPGADNSGSERLRALAGLSNQVGEIAFKAFSSKRQKAGALAGAQSVKRNEEGEIQAPELQSEFTIFGKNFNRSAVLAHRAQIGIDTKEDLDRIQNEFKLDPEGFKNAVSAARKGMIQGMPEELSVIVGQDFDSSVSSRLSKINSDFFRRETEAQQATFLESIESGTDDLLNSIRSGDVERTKEISIQNEAFLNEAVDAGLIKAGHAVKLKENILERSTEQNALRSIDQIVFNEELSIEEQLEKGSAFIDDLRKKELKDLSPEQKDSLVNVVSGKLAGLQRQLAQANSQKNIEDERRISNLKVNANNAFDTPSNLIENIEAEFNGGFISGNERTALLNDVFGGQNRQTQSAKDFSAVAKKLTGDNPEIVLSDKIVSDYYGEVLSPDLSEDPAVRIAQQAQYVSVLKAVPSQIKNEIKNNLLSGDAALIVQSIDLIGRIDKIPGLPELAISTNQQAFALWVRDLSVNLEPEEAVKIARELTDPNNKARVEAKEKELKATGWGSIRDKYPEWANDVFEGTFGGDRLTDGINAQQVTSEYKTLFEAGFKSGMDESQAKDYAAKRLESNWKDSQFGFMKHPPENFYAVQGNSEYMMTQLVSDIRKGTVGVKFGKDDVFLVSDDKTDRQASHQQPTYRMMMRMPDGSLAPVIMQDENGNPSSRWAPDQKKQQKKIMDINEEKTKADRARSIRDQAAWLPDIGL